MTAYRYLFILGLFTLINACTDSTDQPIDPTPEDLPEIVRGTIEVNIAHNGVSRSYLLYVPDSYMGDREVPLILNFHGFGSNANDQMNYGDFRSIADREGFILVHPQGTVLNGNTHWNVGGFTNGSTADDLGYTEAVITDISDSYMIDQDRVYATGMSNGGFFSFLLACQSSNRIAAIASVTGSMTPVNLAACDPQQLIPILQFHGTEDDLVLYDGNLWSVPMEDVLIYWTGVNQVSDQPFVRKLLDTNTMDGSSVELFEYGNASDDAMVVHYKIEGGGHTWPGTKFNTPGTNYDIDASEIIWEFFNQYNLNGRR